MIELAEIIRANIRNVDIPGRYGGDEFFIIMPETSLAEAKITAERIRSTVEDKLFSIQSYSLRLTISLGLAELEYEGTGKASGELIDWIINKADDCLYKVKKYGGNNIAL